MRITPRYASAAQALVRVHQVLRPRGALAVNRDLVELQRLGEGYFLRVMAGESGLQLGDHPFAQFLRRCGADFLQEGREEPAANGPGHAVAAVEDRGAGVEASIDVDL